MRKLLGPRVGGRWGKVGVFAWDRAALRWWLEAWYLVGPRLVLRLVLLLVAVALFQRVMGYP